MVKICNQPYPPHSEYETYFERFPYPLSDFQKYSIEAILTGHHVLTTAHTGSGKTLAAEFAIQYFFEQGKKLIYTSPIKALSNQKYYEFTQKYPHISFGLLTGDIKTNPNADVLIMTTEILMNYLFNLNYNKGEEELQTTSQSLSFQIDIQNELACVVFDEVHYINDEHRGHVWEQTILMLPAHIQMVMLSATIDAPEKFADWCENCKYSVLETPPEIQDKKCVYLASTNHRVVPLTHYGYVAANEALFKSTKNKELEQKWRKSANTIIKIQTEKGQYIENGVKEITELLDVLENKELRMKRKFVLNQLATYLKEHEMLPAIAFVFSRKQVEMCAKEITTALLEDDSKVPYIVKKECDQIIRKLNNYQEYLQLPEYIELVSLLEKGVGIHHSGMIPVLREIVELMISKGYIKWLFATESFAIGLDCPIRTAVFTGLTKFDGKGERFLMYHEYTQMAGRAGRRGIDTLGYVIHCNNLFPLPTTFEYKKILCGKPQTLISKFHIDYSMVLHLLKRGVSSAFEHFAGKSMIQNEIAKQNKSQSDELDKKRVVLEDKKRQMSILRTPPEICEKIIQLEKQITISVNKKKREAEREINKIKEQHKYWKDDVNAYTSVSVIEKEYVALKTQKENTDGFLVHQTQLVCSVLLENGFIKRTVGEEPDANVENYELTIRGHISSNINEIHPLIMGELICEWNQMDNFTVFQIIGLLSCFADVKLPEEKRFLCCKTKDAFLTSKIDDLCQKIDKYERVELERQIYTGIKYNDMLMYDLVDEMMEWAEHCVDEASCKYFLQTKIYPKSISLGDFTKACLKISAIAKEWVGVGEKMGYVEWIHKLSLVDGLLLKYIATSQSLYV